jgi:surface-anchored protein
MALAVAVTAAGFASPLAASAAGPYGLIVDQGHVDAFDIEYEGGQLKLHFADTLHVEWEPADVLMVAKDPQAFVAGPFGGNYTFLNGGSEDGAWILPFAQDPDLLWPGLSSHLANEWSGLTISLLDSTVPAGAALHLWQQDNFGNPVRKWSTNDLATYGSFSFGYNQHMHFAWGFTERGLYRIDVQVSGTHSTDGAKQSSIETYSICVGDPETDCGVTSGGGGGGGDPVDPVDPTDSAEVIVIVNVAADGLTISVANGGVTLLEGALVNQGKERRFTGTLPQVSVVDLREVDTGWVASGVATQLTHSLLPEEALGANHLGWTPVMVYYTPGQDVHAGPSVAPGNGPSAGLAVARELGDAHVGESRGTTIFEAGLVLEIPTSAVPGEYTATLTLTVI